jgi:hypothetical protein
MDNQTLLNSYTYLLATMLVVVLLLVYQVFFVHRPVVAVVKRMLGESMGDAPPFYNNRFDGGMRTDVGQSGTVGFRPASGEGFLSGYEPPVFREVGDLNNINTVREQQGYRAVGNVIVDKDGNVVTQKDLPESMVGWRPVEGMSGNADKIASLEANPWGPH